MSRKVRETFYGEKPVGKRFGPDFLFAEGGGRDERLKNREGYFTLEG